jgi:hypothetical protein
MPKKNSDGPFVALATFCERALQEKDGVLSLIRIVDRIEVTRKGKEASAEMSPGGFNLTLCIGLKSGGARGRHRLELRMEDPSGQISDLVAIDVLFEKDDHGTQAVFQIPTPLSQDGLYWVHVVLGKQQLTRIPLRVVYRGTSSAGS